MAMISGRLRCGITIFQRILTAESALPQLMGVARALGNPSPAEPQDQSLIVGAEEFCEANVMWLSSPASRLLRYSHFTNGSFQRYSFFSSSSSVSNNKESNQSLDHDTESTKIMGDSTPPEQTEDADLSPKSKDPQSQSSKKRRSTRTKLTQFSDSDSEPDLSIDALVKLVAEKEEQLKLKHAEIEKMQDKVLRSYAEMENVLDRTKREAENTKIFSIQNFAKNLLDVADNLGRASSVVKDSFSKIDSSKDPVGSVPILKTLLEGVEMTEKQLTEVFRKSGVEKFDPTNEQFDPNRHHAVFQIPDASKPSGTVAAVLKPGYMIYDRVLRPAEVGVTDAVNNESDQSPEH